MIFGIFDILPRVGSEERCKIYTLTFVWAEEYFHRNGYSPGLNKTNPFPVLDLYLQIFHEHFSTTTTICHNF